MTLIMVLTGWCLVSLPVGLLVGPLLARRTRPDVLSDPAPVTAPAGPAAPAAPLPL